jgi:hypothetical protein
VISTARLIRRIASLRFLSVPDRLNRALSITVRLSNRSERLELFNGEVSITRFDSVIASLRSLSRRA